MNKKILLAFVFLLCFSFVQAIGPVPVDPTGYPAGGGAIVNNGNWIYDWYYEYYLWLLNWYGM